MTEPRLGPDRESLAIITELAGASETPFYVYDSSVIAARIKALRSALPDGSQLLYSAKANPHPQVLAAAVSSGCGLELASPGELQRVKDAGLDSAEMVVVGPAKSDRFLLDVLAGAGRKVVIESSAELRRLSELAQRTSSTDVPVLLRLSLAGAKGSLRMSGQQFGMDREDVLRCHQILTEVGRLRFLGYHAYMASQLLNVADIVHNTHLAFEEVRDLASTTGRIPQRLDVGGGFGIPYTEKERSLNLTELAETLAALVASASVNARELIFESGRFVAGPAGALVCRVVDKKTIRGQMFVMLDGGTNSSGQFGGLNSARKLAHSVIRRGELIAGGEIANVCGPLCTPMDRLATLVPCAADVGDLIVWWNQGAYGLTAAPTAFLSFSAPREVVI